MRKTDIFILGKGPAGIQAAIYAKRANLNPIVVGKDLGMCLKATTVENLYGFEAINGEELAKKGVLQAKSLGIEVIDAEVLSLSLNEEGFLVKTLEEDYLTDSFLFASGTHRNTARIKNLRRYEGKGVSYCAVCDAFFFKNKVVAILGNGEYASNEVDEVIDIAKKVYVLTNGKDVEASFDSRVTIIEKPVLELKGEGKLEQVIFDDEVLEVDGLFVALGSASSTDLAQKIGLELQRDRIVVNKNMETNIPGIFAAGDCTPGYQQIAKALGDGCVAGMNMSQYIRALKRKKRG